MVALSVPTQSAAVCVNSCVLTSHRTRLNVFSIGVIWYHFGFLQAPLRPSPCNHRGAGVMPSLLKQWALPDVVERWEVNYYLQSLLLILLTAALSDVEWCIMSGGLSISSYLECMFLSLCVICVCECVCVCGCVCVCVCVRSWAGVGLRAKAFGEWGLPTQ